MKPQMQLVAPAPRVDDDLRARAARNWPNSSEMQARWMRAVLLARKGCRGWLLDASGPLIPTERKW